MQHFDVGVLVERSKASSPWLDYVWTPCAVVQGAPAAEPWTMIHEADDRAQFFVGIAKIELFRTATAQYRDNLATGAPKVWVVLRPSGVEPPYDLMAVTADPDEGEGYTQSGSDLVEPVAMPPSICAALEAFVAEHHVEREFFKRRRDRASPEALGQRPRGGKV